MDATYEFCIYMPINYMVKMYLVCYFLKFTILVFYFLIKTFDFYALESL